MHTDRYPDSSKKTILKPRWNFRKADWNVFSKFLDVNIRRIDPIVTMYASLIWLREQKNYISSEATDPNIYPAGMRKAINFMQYISKMAMKKLQTNS